MSTDIFDEIEDGDDSPIAGRLGVPKAINIAMALLTLAACSLTRVPSGINGPLLSAVLTASDGQHRDLGGGSLSNAEEYFAIIDRKAAGLIATFCVAGASTSGVNASEVSAYGRFGLHRGRFSQLSRVDIHQR